MDRVGNFDQILPLLDSLQDVAFFFKDRKSRFVMNNLRAVASFSVGTEDETLGKMGYEFFPADKVALYLQQDEEVMRTGKPIINALSPAPEPGSNAIILYSKIPLRDKEGKVIGLAGVWREVTEVSNLPPDYGRLSSTVQMMHDRYSEQLTVKELAEEAGMSQSQFGRLFRKLFGVSPREYLISVRINAAAHLLADTNKKTTVVAMETGFYDHSHFSRTFRKIMGRTPRQYRRMHSY